MGFLPRQFLDATVAIGRQDPNTPRVSWNATGFLVAWPLSEPEQGHWVFLVTNRHVLSDLKVAVVRLNLDDQVSLDFEVPLETEDGPSVIFHPNSEVDVGVVKLSSESLLPENLQLRVFLDKHRLPLRSAEAAELSEGDPVFVLGYPMGLVNQKRQYAICRSGSIARIRDFFGSQNSTVLLDAPVFPGNSGGPVVLKPEVAGLAGRKVYTTSRLIGLVSSYVPYEETAVSLQTNLPRIIFQENSGLTVMVPIDYADEIIATLLEPDSPFSSPQNLSRKAMGTADQTSATTSATGVEPAG